MNTVEHMAILYQCTAVEPLLDLFENVQDAADGAALAQMASALYFSRHEPHNAARAARRLVSPEECRLRAKTAELWEAVMAPLPEEPLVHLLILTCNRASYVENALRQLGKTSYRNYSVYIADNGSTDGTWDIVQRAQDFFPSHVKVNLLNFPTNIGRPAGHNWLLTAFDHSAADYIAIGDDDLIAVPQDWLTRMVQTARAIPGCGCVGGKALSPGWPATVHGGIRNIIEFSPQAVALTNEGDCPDVGQFDYIDIVDHVIGCLHIFDRCALESAGLFDIRLSPCQFVDIEHHLRMRLAGMRIVFNGLIHFMHLRGMGKEVQKSASLNGNSLGNRIKLFYKYDQNLVQRELAARREDRRQWLLS